MQVIVNDGDRTVFEYLMDENFNGNGGLCPSVADSPRVAEALEMSLKMLPVGKPGEAIPIQSCNGQW